MVRAPCCQKVGLKKGPWSHEEDHILVNYIHRYGHGNWRALPKQAGLLRCGKSCRLRWTNYLRPDIKRGNFTKQEEDTIISLHQKLGNKWSAIAAMLPGRTDNEIKNVWHTHLKKRVSPDREVAESSKKKKMMMMTPADTKTNLNAELVNLRPDTDPSANNPIIYDNSSLMPLEQSHCDFSSVAADSSAISGDTTNNNMGAKEESFSSEKFEGMDESFWLEALSIDNSAESMNLITSVQVPPEAAANDGTLSLLNSPNSYDMDFWLNVFREAEFL